MSGGPRSLQVQTRATNHPRRSAGHGASRCSLANHTGNPPAVAVVHEEVCTQRRCRVVIYAAGAKRDVAHDERLLHARKPAGQLRPEGKLQ